MAPPTTLKKTIARDEQQTNNSPIKTIRTCHGEERSPSAIKRTCCGDKGSLSAIKGSYNG
jgi:hypothetical protein